MARLAAQIVAPRTYARIAYLLLALPLGQLEGAILITGLAVGLGLAVVTVGIPILVGTLMLSRWMAIGERRLVHALLDFEIPAPYRPLPAERGWERLKAFLSDPATWRDVVFLLLQVLMGLVSFVVTVTVLGVALGALAAPAWYWALPDGIELGIAQVDSLAEAVALVPIGAVLLFLGIPALNGLGRLYGRFAQLLLGTNADPALTAQVTELRGSRARVIAAADAERRRLERDLHDGAQQRLVALALTLRMAEKRAAETGDDGTGDLVRRAGEEARLALEELRDLARGIHPAILTNRGLAAALDDLASRAAVPVSILARPDERLPEQVEAAAYFIVSESLANVAKHARATSAWVRVAVAGGALVVEVRDDGVGGTQAGSGSGLQGLEDRVGALDGSLAIESDSGSGTRVLARIPVSAAGTAERPSARGLPEPEATARDARRRRRLRLRLELLGGVGALLVAIWLLTGTVSAWVAWPLLGLGSVAALDCWLVCGNPTLRLGEPRARRHEALFVGVLAIVNLTVVGAWLAAGNSYFWPGWVMFGTVVLLGLVALGERVARRLPSF